MQKQKNEGCQVYHFLVVNKVAGNFHFAPGKSFQQSHVHGAATWVWENMEEDVSGQSLGLTCSTQLCCPALKQLQPVLGEVLQPSDRFCDSPLDLLCQGLRSRMQYSRKPGLPLCPGIAPHSPEEMLSLTGYLAHHSVLK